MRSLLSSGWPTQLEEWYVWLRGGPHALRLASLQRRGFTGLGSLSHFACAKKGGRERPLMRSHPLPPSHG